MACVFGWQLKEEVDGLLERLEQANNALKEDWVRWEISVRADLKTALLMATERNIEHFKKVSPELKTGQI